ncbi:hypothetical protein NECAME_11610 [Necator americanus]|uniref:Uncharacterized protein n=1 Tax=Necator americanus TaxID=51031 RepID=W2T3F9_NECAM|nr:hypothetical protein NECAME_11610 [Necator americanus]ETN76550.1 hypothetical protein NECAME_11610 [Necator americanus]
MLGPRDLLQQIKNRTDETSYFYVQSREEGFGDVWDARYYKSILAQRIQGVHPLNPSRESLLLRAKLVQGMVWLTFPNGSAIRVGKSVS